MNVFLPDSLRPERSKSFLASVLQEPEGRKAAIQDSINMQFGAARLSP